MAAKPPGKGKLKAPPKSTPKITSPLPTYMFHLIMALVTVVILLGGYVFYYFQEQQMRQRIEGGLSIMAQLKAEQITEWRAERLMDANILTGSPFFTEGVEKYLAAPMDTEAKDKVLARLAIIEKAYAYQDILLTDANGNVLLSLNESIHRLSDMTLSQLAVAIKEHKAAFTDFHYPPDSDYPHLDVVAPLLPWGQDSPQAIGAVVFCIDPAQYLYPLLQSSPMPTETAETLLVERDGDQVLFLNELRHRKDTALKLRIPLSRQEVPAVMAVLGTEGVVEGTDYRGIDVLAALKHIPDSPWYMVSKIDTSEALAAWHSRGGMIIAFFAGLLVAALAMVGFIWQRRQRLAYQALYQAESETQALRSHFEYLVKYANDIIILVDQKHHIIEVNDRALDVYGYARQEMLGMPLTALVAPENLTSYQARLQTIQQKGTIVAEAIHQRKDGSTFPVEVSGRSINIEDKTYIQEIIRDITERKAKEQEYRTILSTTIDGFWQADMEGHFLDVNEAYCRMIGYSRDELQNMTIMDIEAIEKPEETAARIRKIKDIGYDYFESRHRRKNGEIIDVEISVNHLPTDGGLMIVFIRDITERKRIENSLCRSEQNFRDSIENSPLGIRIVTSDGETIYANRALLDIYGYSSAEELKATPTRERYTPESYAQHQERKEKRRHGEFVPESYEISIVRKDGEVRNLAVSRGKVQWNGKRQFHVAYQDITERKRAEQALRESETKHRTLFETMAQGVVYQDAEGYIFSANPAAERILGVTLDQMQGRTSMDPRWKAIHEDGSDFPGATHPAMVAVKTGKEVRNVIMGVFHPGKNEYVWINIHAVPQFKQDDKKPYQVYTTFDDITERKQAEEALQQSEEKYRTVLNEIYEVYYELDHAGNYTFFNDALCRQTGYSRTELLGMNYRRHMPQEDWKSIYEKFNLVYRTGGLLRWVPLRHIIKDGSIIDTEDTVLPLRNERGEVIGFRGLSRDVTERKKAEEERRQLELKAQITSRLASVGEMAAGVAHEINNPLTGVTGYAQLLMDREDIPPDIRKDLAAINDGAQRVAGIVQRLLAFSRQTKPERKLVDINELIESTLVLRAYHLRVNNIEVITRLAPDLPETVVDPGQIQQVLLNLIVNAETEMKLARGKGKLTITTEKSRNTIKICVKDDGPGIKPEVTDRIFDPFFTTREVGQGTGLGLSLCYGIVNEHKGKIYAESQPGKGATFTIELPVVTEVAPIKLAEPVIKKPKKKVKARILVVDDEQVIRDFANRVLSSEGHKIETVDNAADAVKKIESQKYDLILMDIKMPGISGMTLYKRIQKIDKSLARRVVFITGDIMGADTEKFLSQAKVAHIEKPFDAERLSREVQRALSAGN